MSRSSFDEVITTTGMVRVAASALRRRNTSMPSTLGILISSSTRRGGRSRREKRNSSASAPSLTQCTGFATLPRRNARMVISASSALSSASRISPGSSMRGLPRQGEVEAGTLARRALRPDPAAVARDDTLHDRQAYPRALEFVGTVQALEHAEELVGVARVEADAVVAHPVVRFARLLATADVDARARALRAVLEGVADEVGPHLPHERCVRARRRQRAELERRVPAGFELIGHFPRKRAHVDARTRRLLAPKAREREQVVDQPSHAHCARAHHRDEALRLGV